MNIEEQIKDFYGRIRFPGSYTLSNLNYYDIYENRFLKPYVDASKRATRILEIGCGAGYITNLIALKNKNTIIDAIDFSDSIHYAETFSKKHGIKNINYLKIDFLAFIPKHNYDLIISNGVLHHIPNLNFAIDIINDINAEEMVLGVYNKFGKLPKKLFTVKYVNEILYKDQEQSPYEISFTDRQFRNYFPNHESECVTPGNKVVNLRNLLNYKNGGLSVYHFSKKFLG